MKVHWVGPRHPQAAELDGVGFEVIAAARDETVPDDRDAVVLDARAFSDPIELMDHAAALGIPCVVLGDATTLEAVLEELPPHAEVCLREATPRLLERRLEQAISRQREVRDRLTGLMVRGRFLALLEDLLEGASEGRAISLAVLDLDRFKELNDHHGHAVGDDVLRTWAARIGDIAGPSDLVARLGGEEIGLALVGDEAEAKARIESALATTRDAAYTAADIYITASAGVSTVRAPLSCADMLQRVDEALYAAKADGRDRAVTYGELEADAEAAGEDVEARAFEHMTRVISERVAHVIARRGRRLFRELRQEADVDALTGLYNRRYLDRRLAHDLDRAARERQPFVLALLDVDHFGAVNKKYGWPVGDRVLQAVAGRARSCMDNTGWVARYGGEELALVCPGATMAEVQQLLEALRRSIASDAHPVRDGELRITVSIGAAERDDEDLDQLMGRVSDALRGAKDGGRDRLVAG